MFHFYLPWFILLLPLPFILQKFSLKLLKKEESAPFLYFPSLRAFQEKGYKKIEKKKASSKSLFFTILSLAWCFLILALMQPEKVDEFKRAKQEGYDLMLAVDISSSMQAVDFSSGSQVISRLDITKEVVGKFVRGRQGDRVGLITFGEKAYLHVPLTLDTLSLTRMLEDTTPGMAGNATAIGDAIGLSVRTLRERPQGSRVLILLTDGVDNASSIPPLEAAKLAKQYGIRIYTIGVGKKGPVPFPTPLGGYAMAELAIDEELLKEVAKQTGGKSFLASDSKSLESIYREIDLLEKTEANQDLFFIRDPLYYYPLGICLLLLVFLFVYQFKMRKGKT